MRIGLYGFPGAGKSYLMHRIHFLPVLEGAHLLHAFDPLFPTYTPAGREKVRRALAQSLLNRDSFLMDGHYAFGQEVAFTQEDGMLYDVFLYLYISPEVLAQRMAVSEKNQKYRQFPLAEWQQQEITALRAYCHAHDKDFYVLDHPPENQFKDVSVLLDFLQAILAGFSCVSFARQCASAILQRTRSSTVCLFDGDRTLTAEDTSRSVFGYRTHLFDGNFYTGYQAWLQAREFQACTIPHLTGLPIPLNHKLLSALTPDSFILTSGHEKVWRTISQYLDTDFFCGPQMSADTKFFITKFLQEAGKTVFAYGDSMNDYYMLRQADQGFLVQHQDGSISRSLQAADLGGLHRV